MIKKFFVVLLSVLFATMGLSACKGPNKISNEPTVLNVKVYKAGYGDAWFTALKSKFEEMYYEEGYKINVVESSINVQGAAVMEELLLGRRNGVDMYFAGGLSPVAVAIQSVDEGFQMAADLSDVYELKPIKENKTEENLTIKDKMKEGYDEYLVYNGRYEDYNGMYFVFPAFAMPGGLIVNEELLNSYGLEIPLTTDELINCFETIAKDSAETGVYPTTWAGNNAYNYWRPVEDVWAAQYDGVEGYKKWVSMNPGEGKNPVDAVNVYDQKGFEYSLTVMETMLNLDYAPIGTRNATHGNAQHQFLTGKAVFMANGAWLQNEMIQNYNDSISKMQMISAPVLSQIGMELNLDGNNGNDREKCDKVLSAIVAAVDEGETNEEIISMVEAAPYSVQIGQNEKEKNAKIDKIRESRAIYDDAGVEYGFIVNEYSTKKEIATLFLRFVASDDASIYMNELANALTAFDTIEEIYDDETTTTFIKSLQNLITYENAVSIHRFVPGDSLRTETGLAYFPNEGEIELTIADGKKGAAIWEDAGNYAKDNWEKLLKDVGIIE